MFRGQVPKGVDPRTLTQVEPLRREYQDPRRASRVVDDQGLERVLLFPTLGCGVEQALRFDIPATMATLRAFNRWLEEDWRFAYDGRLIAAPMLSLADPDAAVAEVDYAARARRADGARPPGAGARRPRPRAIRSATRATTRCGRASPRRRSRSRSTSATAATRRCVGAAWGGPDKFEPFRGIDPFDQARRVATARSTTRSAASSSTACSRATRACASRASRTAPTGCTRSSSGCKKQANQTPWIFAEDPLDTIRAPRLGHAVLRRGHAQARRPDRRRARAVRLRLAPRRGPREPDRLRQGARTTSPTTRSARSCATTASTLLHGEAAR